MFGKNKKSAKGKKPKLLGLFKSSAAVSPTETVGLQPVTDFNPMEVRGILRSSEEERIDAEIDGLVQDVEQDVLEEMNGNPVHLPVGVPTPPATPHLDATAPEPCETKEASGNKDHPLDQTAESAEIREQEKAEQKSEPSQDVVGKPGEITPTITPSFDPSFVIADDVQQNLPHELAKAPTNNWKENISLTDSMTLLFGPDGEDESPISLKKEPVIAPKPELKSIFRSDGQLVSAGRLGRFVHNRKQVNGDALDAAYRIQQVTGKPIGQILVANGFLTDKQRVEAILSVEESRISQEQVSRSRIPVSVLDQNSIIISAEHDETIYIASPHSEAIIEPIVAEYYPEKKIEFVSYDPSAMRRFITAMRRSASVEDVRETKETMLDRVVYKALEANASDIHISPLADCYAVQFRIDGMKRIIHMGALDEYHTVMAQVKDKATIDLAEKRKSQDGSYQVEYNGKMIDLRVSTLPVQAGEHVTIRVLDSDRVHPNLDTLGITDVHKWRRGFKQRSGLCIIAGATGSGKTTTLNSSLREIDRFSKAIFSIEDPVEYRVPFVGQVSTNMSVGLDFAAAIKAFMRNDPDIIILGEVRDAETARNAIKAADTGHLVLVTLHTSSIMSTISRLKDLGVEPREIRYMLRAILVQHLIPKLCTSCHGHDPDCPVCKGQRYVGRTVASECEYFESVKDVDRLLEARNDHISDDQRTWVSMAEDAVNQMRRGITDVQGLERTFGSEIYQYLTAEERELCSNL